MTPGGAWPADDLSDAEQPGMWERADYIDDREEPEEPTDDVQRTILAAKLREIADRDDPRLHGARGFLIAEADLLDAGLPIYTVLVEGQVWQRHRLGRQGQIHQLRVEDFNDRYVYGTSLTSGRPTQILRSRDSVGGPLGYHLVAVDNKNTGA